MEVLVALVVALRVTDIVVELRLLVKVMLAVLVQAFRQVFLLVAVEAQAVVVLMAFQVKVAMAALVLLGMTVSLVVVEAEAVLVGILHNPLTLDLVVQAVAVMVVAVLALSRQLQVHLILVAVAVVLNNGMAVVVTLLVVMAAQVLWSYATLALKEALEEPLFLAVAIPTTISIHLVHTQHRVQIVNHDRRTRIGRWCQGDQRGV
jgi:hypothetical protein